jgi:hypothetical protein
LKDGFLNKKIQFTNENFFQEYLLHGKSEFLKKDLIFRELKYKYSDLSNLYKLNFSEEYKKRRKYLDYYHELFVSNNHRKHHILETEVQLTETISLWRKVLPNSTIILTSSDLSKVNSNEELDIFYFNKTYPKSLKLLFDNKNLSFDFDLIILKNIEILMVEKYLTEFTNKLSLGGSIVVEGVDLEKVDKFDDTIKKMKNFEQYYLSEIICFDESYDSDSEIMIKITKKL